MSQPKTTTEWVTRAVCVLLAIGSGPAMAQAPAPPTGLATIFDRSSGWIAADGASTLDLGDGRTLWLFGDTLVGSVKPDGGAAEGAKFVNNSIAIQKIGRPGTPITANDASFYWGPETDGKPSSWALPPSRDGAVPKDHWLWPAGGGVLIRNGDSERLVLFFAMMRRRDKEDSVWNFQFHGTATVGVAYPGSPAEKWKPTTALLRDFEPDMDAGRTPRMISWGVVVLKDPVAEGSLLIFGVDGTQVLDKKLMLARAPAASLERFATWSFRAGDKWSEHEEEALPIADKGVDDFSVSKMTFDGREQYVLVQMEPNLGARMIVRIAERPEGPWTDGRTIFTCPEPKEDKRSLVYSAKAHPELIGHAGGSADSLPVTYCVNSTDFWYMLSHVRLYRPHAVEIPMQTLRHAAAGEP